MKRLSFFVVGCLLAVAFGTASAEGFRTFKSADGREMVAQLKSVSGDEVTIVRKADGRRITAPMALFSSQDIEYIKNWDELQRLSRDDAVSVNIRRSTGRSQQEQ